MRILVVEDNPDILVNVVDYLTLKGLVVDAMQHGTSALEQIRQQEYDLVVLDLSLPGMDGLELCRQLRAEHNPLPVVMVTARDTLDDKLHGFDAGADDYLVKPFGMMEMVSRIKAVLRRTRDQARPSLVYFGELTLEPQRYTVYHQDEQIPLTLKEFDLLSLLMLHPDRVFTRQELLDKVWGTQFFGETRTVDVHIGTLRTKLGACGEYIKTVRGVGYRMEEPHD